MADADDLRSPILPPLLLLLLPLLADPPPPAADADPLLDMDTLVVDVEGGVVEVNLLIEKLLQNGPSGIGGVGPPTHGGMYGLGIPGYGAYNSDDGGTSPAPLWPYGGNVGIGGGGGPVLVPINTPFGALLNSPSGPSGGKPPGIDVTGFSPLPLMSGEAAAV